MCIRDLGGQNGGIFIVLWSNGIQEGGRGEHQWGRGQPGIQGPGAASPGSRHDHLPPDEGVVPGVELHPCWVILNDPDDGPRGDRGRQNAKFHGSDTHWIGSSMISKYLRTLVVTEAIDSAGLRA